MIRGIFSSGYFAAKRVGRSIEKKFADKNIVAWFDNPDRERLRLDYALDKNSLVLDVGGYKGQWASDIFAMYLCRVYVFEPVKKFADDIKVRFKNNDHITTFAIGLGGKTRQDCIHLRDDGSSVFGAGSSEETVQITDIAQFMDDQVIRTVDLMKINIEGGEYELLERLIETGLVQSIKNLQVQFHRFVPDAESRMTNIQQKLGKTHRLTYQYRFVWENWQLK
ncbi:FkbM family methyltransferase [Patescibacteria group bacterium]|nr:FkbM family methyltransferase [Patescibacteria group bacterium]